jgi:hypothetical protein
VLAEPSERALEALAGRVVREAQALAGLALGLVEDQHREQQVGVGADDRLEPGAQDRDVLVEREAREIVVGRRPALERRLVEPARAEDVALEVAERLVRFALEAVVHLGPPALAVVHDVALGAPHQRRGHAVNSGEVEALDQRGEGLGQLGDELVGLVAEVPEPAPVDGVGVGLRGDARTLSVLQR